MGIETVVQDLALASHPNPAQSMFRGRETPASGLFEFTDTKATRVRSKEAFDDLGRDRRQLRRSAGGWAGGQ